jgi:hypothetical protein
MYEVDVRVQRQTMMRFVLFRVSRASFHVRGVYSGLTSKVNNPRLAKQRWA